jgi:hypothetical protein
LGSYDAGAVLLFVMAFSFSLLLQTTPERSLGEKKMKKTETTSEKWALWAETDAENAHVLAHFNYVLRTMLTRRRPRALLRVLLEKKNLRMER